jgi:hypothetical protein
MMQHTHTNSTKQAKQKKLPSSDGSEVNRDELERGTLSYGRGKSVIEGERGQKGIEEDDPQGEEREKPNALSPEQRHMRANRSETDLPLSPGAIAQDKASQHGGSQRPADTERTKKRSLRKR